MAHLGMVVCKDPRKHWVLHEVAVRPSRQRIQVHEVLKVADLSPLPGHEKRDEGLSCWDASHKMNVSVTSFSKYIFPGRGLVSASYSSFLLCLFLRMPVVKFGKKSNLPHSPLMKLPALDAHTSPDEWKGLAPTAKRRRIHAG